MLLAPVNIYRSSLAPEPLKRKTFGTEAEPQNSVVSTPGSTAKFVDDHSTTDASGRFHQLVKTALTPHIEQSPPCFPWESSSSEQYEDDASASK